MTAATVVTEPLGGSALSLAAQAATVPAEWYPRKPTNAAEWRARVRSVAAGFADGSWLDALAPALGSSGRAAERLRRVASAGGVVVTTGQQPGLFGGPVYTWSKALSALALADELAARTELPVAAVFWAATDDADFPEARWTKVAVDGRVIRLELRKEPAPGTPMSEVPLGTVDAELEELRAAAGSAAYPAALDAAQHAYGADATVGGAYVGLLRALLEPLGVAVIDASHAAVRRRGAAMLHEALRRAPEIASALASRSAEVRAAGFEPQVTESDDLSLVFRLRGGVKRRIPVAEAGTAAAWAEVFGPNVLLRPVLERAILPTVAYVAGPAELAYFAQVSAVADALSAERPLAVPRWSGTIIEPHVARILGRLGIAYAELADPHAVEGKLARAALPETVVLALERIRAAIEGATDALSTGPDTTTLIPPAALAGARNSMLHRLRRLERRYAAAAKRREREVMQRVSTVRAHLYPDGERQERALNFLPMLARGGPALLDAMSAAARAHARALVGSVSPSPASAVSTGGGRGAPQP